MSEQDFWQLIYSLVILRGGDTGEAQRNADYAAADWRARWGDE